MAFFTNKNAEKIAIEIYDVGEQVKLNGDFILDGISENTAGYSVQVLNTSLLQKSEFEEKYQSSLDELHKEDLIFILEMKISNQKNTTGKLFFTWWTLFDQSLSVPCEVQEDALQIIEPIFQQSSFSSIQIKPEKEHIIKISYLIPKEHKNKFEKSDSFFILITKYPVRKMVSMASFNKIA